MADPTVIMILDEAYMANLLTEELCSDGSPLADLRVTKVSPQTTGSFRVELALRDEKEA